MSEYTDKLHQLQDDLKAQTIQQEASGWHSLMCPICNGGSEGKISGGFYFDTDGIIYNCFRGKCDANTGYTLGEFVGKKFRSICEALYVKIPVELYTIAKDRIKAEIDSLDKDLFTPIEWVDEGDYDATHINQCDTQNGELVRSYLDRRYASLDDIFVMNSGKWEGMFFVLLKMGSKNIGRVFFGSKNMFEVSENDQLLYIPNGQLPKQPIIVEGVVDALSVPNAVALMGNYVTPEKAFILRNTSPILLPDFDKGNKFIDAMTKYKWRMSIPEWNVDDPNDAIVRYGKICTAMDIADSIITSKHEAEIRMKLKVGGNKFGR